jgi:hypothetical protein
MRRLLVFVVLVAASGTGLLVTGPATASPPTRHLTVAGTDVGMYPVFEEAILRYAATTTAATAGTLEITATTTDPDGVVLVDGVPTTSPTTTVTGLTEGQDVPVVIDDSAGVTAYSVMYLPAGFPALHATTDLPGQVQPGLMGLTLNAFDGVQPAFGAIVDRNGVPVYAISGPYDTDLKQQPNGEVTVSRLTSKPGQAGYSLVTLDTTDRSLSERAWRDVGDGLTHTDGHDSIRLPDGGTVLIGYEPNADTGKTDATIQKLDAADEPVFTWSSGTDPSILGESLAAPTNPDYAHINSVVSVEDGDIIASFRHLSAAYRIATVAHDGYVPGQIVWKLGGRDSTFAFVGDPFPGGPCAQHTVSELPNGHILVFDNGTDGLCVDPSAPDGPGVVRGETRVTEYALDLDAEPKPTATLVWSYTPAGKYAQFAGSARRLANGNTLIGWAADRSALATEVDAAGNTVWELEAADPPAGRQRYATYRAELITALHPEVGFAGPRDGATVLEGAAVPAAGSCTDFTGTALDACTTTGIVGARLDTSSPGPHTWTVTAMDGAGNTTTRTRHYTVLTAPRPDGLIRKDGGPWRGGGVYGSASDQAIRLLAGRGQTVSSQWLVQNDGERTERFRLDGAAGNPRWKLRYFRGGKDVTQAVSKGTYRTEALAPGRRVSLRVTVTPSGRARLASTRTLTLRASSLPVAATDNVAIRVQVRR